MARTNAVGISEKTLDRWFEIEPEIRKFVERSVFDQTDAEDVLSSIMLNFLITDTAEYARAQSLTYCRRHLYLQALSELGITASRRTICQRGEYGRAMEAAEDEAEIAAVMDAYRPRIQIDSYEELRENGWDVASDFEDPLAGAYDERILAFFGAAAIDEDVKLMAREILVEELTETEIAVRHGISTQSVKRYMQRESIKLPQEYRYVWNRAGHEKGGRGSAKTATTTALNIAGLETTPATVSIARDPSVIEETLGQVANRVQICKVIKGNFRPHRHENKRRSYPRETSSLLPSTRNPTRNGTEPVSRSERRHPPGTSYSRRTCHPPGCKKFAA